MTAAQWQREVEELRSALQDAIVGDQPATEPQRLRRRRHLKRPNEDEYPLAAAAYDRLVAVFHDAQCIEDVVDADDPILQDALGAPCVVLLGITSGKHLRGKAWG